MHWEKAQPLIFCQGLFLLLFTVLLIGEAMTDIGESIGFYVGMLVYNTIYLSIDIREITLGFSQYMSDTWNCLDIGRIVFVYFYIVLTLSRGHDDEWISFCLAMAIMFAWFRLIGFFRINYHTRYLIRIIRDIIFYSIPFMVIFIVAVLAIGFSLLALRGGDLDYIDAWTVSYRLSYGDFEEEHPNHPERIIFFIATLFLPLIMLNLLIAIMGEIHDRSLEKFTVSDQLERLELINEISHLIFWKPKSVYKYIHVCKATQLSEMEDSDAWEGKIRALKSELYALEGRLTTKITDLREEVAKDLFN
jgi:hypothetical protein